MQLVTADQRRKNALLRCFALMLCVSALLPSAGRAQIPNQAGPFLGAWCAQGDPGRRASITPNGPFNVTLTNETGSTSTGIISGPNSRQVMAPQWNLVQGNLSPDGRTIGWSNNTFWARCSRHRHVNVQGTWYAGGNRSLPCRIDQRHGRLSLRNEVGQTASGSFTASNQIATMWSGTPIAGTISRDTNRINWSNGTYWTR